MLNMDFADMNCAWDWKVDTLQWPYVDTAPQGGSDVQETLSFSQEVSYEICIKKNLLQPLYYLLVFIKAKEGLWGKPCHKRLSENTVNVPVLVHSLNSEYFCIDSSIYERNLFFVSCKNSFLYLSRKPLLIK